MPKKSADEKFDEEFDKAAEETKAPAKNTGFVPVVAKNLTLPLVKPKIDEPVYLKILEECKVGKTIGDKDAAITTVVMDLATGETMQYLVPAVFQGILHDEYGAPKWGAPQKGQPVVELEPPLEGQEPHNYVGKGFGVTKHAKASGKQYHPHTIQELVL